MIRKWYECTCDYCGNALIHLPYKPTVTDFQANDIIVCGNKIFCDKECLQNYKHDITLKRVGNLKQYQKETNRQ